MRADKKRVSLNSPSMTRIRAALARAREPIDGKTLSARAFVGERTFSASYQQLLISAGLMHVAEYRRNVIGPPIPLFAHGPLVGDPPVKPERFSDAEVCRRWKEKTGYDERRKLDRKLVRPVDPILAALMGLPSRGRHFKEHHNRAGQAPAEGI